MKSGVLMTVCAVISMAALAARADELPASDWITTGTDCKVFAAGDVNGDGFADCLTINGNRDLCVAASVNGWKAANWRILSRDVSPDAVGLAVWPASVGAPGVRVVVVEEGRVVVVPIGAGGVAGERVVIAAKEGQKFTGIVWNVAPRIQDASGANWQIDKDNRLGEGWAERLKQLQPTAWSLSKPPYDAAASEVCRFESNVSAMGGLMGWTVFATSLPYAHRVVRYAVIVSPDARDSDFDGLSDAEEKEIGTDPRDRDTDGDGLLDGWEVHGLPPGRVADLGARLGVWKKDASASEADARLDPRRKDLIVNISYFEQVDRKQFEGEMPRIQKAYRDLHCANPDGTTGVWLHFRDAGPGVAAADQKMPWWDVGGKYFPRPERGMMHWMQVTPWGGGQSSETGDMGGCGNNWAVFAHELGHQMSLSHTGDSAPGWCPLYTSMMNYAYSYGFDGDGAKPHFSNGEFREVVLDEHRLREKLPFAYERVKFLANHPFRFSLKDNGDGTTLIDWNHNGEFDEGEVLADVNYGGSTHAGERKTHALIGSAPSLAVVGGKVMLAAATHKQTAVTVKMHKGSEEWTDETEAASSSSRADPVLVGGPEFGVLFVKRFDGWAAARVTTAAEAGGAPVVGALQALRELGQGDVSGLMIGGRVLVLSRHDDGRIEARWVTAGEKFEVGAAKELELKSAVPPGMAVQPADGSITVVGSWTHDKHGPFTMRVATLRIEGDDLAESQAEWTHGGRPCHCTSRPVAVYPNLGGKQNLVIFHTGWQDGNGTWTGWRTMRIGNKSLDDGWLTSQLYDEWTRSRVALGFADGPDGAFYAFRWDPGDHRDWKINTMFVARGGYGIDDAPMRDFDDGAKIGLWGIRHSILTMPTDADLE